MPLYEYRCQRCGARFERLIRSAATAGTGGAGGQQPAIVCPECASEQVERLLSALARTAPACAPAPGGG
jgi:predicted nucleic acid-binding Zn ribbon protein